MLYCLYSRVHFLITFVPAESRPIVQLPGRSKKHECSEQCIEYRLLHMNTYQRTLALEECVAQHLTLGWHVVALQAFARCFLVLRKQIRMLCTMMKSNHFKLSPSCSSRSSAGTSSNQLGHRHMHSYRPGVRHPVRRRSFLCEKLENECDQKLFAKSWTATASLDQLLEFVMLFGLLLCSGNATISYEKQFDSVCDKTCDLIITFIIDIITLFTFVPQTQTTKPVLILLFYL